SGAAATAVVGGALSGDNNSAFQFTGGTAAIALPQLATGATVASVFLTSGGSGYSSAPTVTFGAAPPGGTTATGTATISGGVVTGITITNPGSGYTAAPAVT